MTSSAPTMAVERALLLAGCDPETDADADLTLRSAVSGTSGLTAQAAADAVAPPQFSPSAARWVVGMDEVGRGALSGPVCVGAVAVDALTGMPPPGLRDSKLLSAAQREGLIEPITAWAPIHALGWASAWEVDACGIVGALRLAGQRALATLVAQPTIVLLDGKHDWLTGPAQPNLFDSLEDGANPADGAGPATAWRVVTRVKADRDCASVAAASVLAKCARDAHMVALAADYPGYGWAANKGYGSAGHLAAIGRLGLSREHRASWRIGPGAHNRG